MSETRRKGVDGTAMLLSSFLVWRIYMLAMGTLLMVAPSVLIGLFGLPPNRDNWIRLLGTLVFIIGTLYFPMIRQPFHKGFVAWTIWARCGFAVITVLFVLAGWFPLILLLFGTIDVASASWTYIGMRRAGL